MYFVKKTDLVTGRVETLAELKDPAKAYELAHELDAASNLGRDEEETDKSPHPCTISIEDEYGNSVWAECARARCPTAGILQ